MLQVVSILAQPIRVESIGFQSKAVNGALDVLIAEEDDDALADRLATLAILGPMEELFVESLGEQELSNTFHKCKLLPEVAK